MAHLPPPPAGGGDSIECVALAIGFEPGGVGLHNAIMAAAPALPRQSLPVSARDHRERPGSHLAAISTLLARLPWWCWIPLTAWLPMYPVRYLMLAALIGSADMVRVRIAVPRRRRRHACLDRARGGPHRFLGHMELRRADACHDHHLRRKRGCGPKARHPDSNLILVAAVFRQPAQLRRLSSNNVPWQPMLIAFVALAAGRRVPETLRHRRRVVCGIFPDMGLEVGDRRGRRGIVERHLRSDHLSPERRCSRLSSGITSWRRRRRCSAISTMRRGPRLSSSSCCLRCCCRCGGRT